MLKKVRYLEVNECPLCGVKNVSRKIKLNIKNYKFFNLNILTPNEGIHLMQCSECKLIYKDRVPYPKDLDKIFNSVATSVWKNNDMSYKKELELIKKSTSKFNSVLDIGSSNGQFLKKVKDIFKIKSAFDIYIDPRCSEHVNGEYIQGFIEDESIKCSKKNYNLITAFDVFEHFYDPKLAINNIVSLLDKNGIIIGETGTVDSTKDLANWWYSKLFEHHIFWGKESLKYLENNHNLKIIYNFNNPHKGKRYMVFYKKYLIIFLKLISYIPLIEKLIFIILKINIKMIGNFFAKDHMLFVLKKI